jgi:hypothetical protein
MQTQRPACTGCEAKQVLLRLKSGAVGRRRTENERAATTAAKSGIVHGGPILRVGVDRFQAAPNAKSPLTERALQKTQERVE